jgi:hypothetical protein
MRQGCRAASCLWQASATRVAGFAAMFFYFSVFLFTTSVLQMFESTAFFGFSLFYLFGYSLVT